MAKAKKQKSGKWRIQIFLGRDPSGKQIIKSFTAGSKREAEALAADYMARGAKPTKETVEDAIAEYIADRRAVLSPASVRSYEANFRILKAQAPALMGTRLDAVDNRKAQNLINQLTQKYSPSSVHAFYATFSIAMNAKKVNIGDCLLPRIPRGEKFIPTLALARRIFAAAKGTELELPIILAAAGLRAGEICGLHPEDFSGDIVHISRDMVARPDGTYIEKPPKTPTSDRFVRLPAGVGDLVAQRGYITHRTPDKLSMAHRRFLAENGFPHFRLHDWRHFMVSSLHAAGCSDAFIMSQGGWSSDFVMKRVYRHLMEDSASAMADKAAAHLGALLPADPAAPEDAAC